MLFNSIEFAGFLPLVFIIYWSVGSKNIRIQNIFLLFASYIFYGWWDWRFLLLLISAAILNYFMGILINDSGTDKKRRNFLVLGLILNIGTLCVFKYFNFFIESFIDLISLAGYKIPESTVVIILPVGISFYMFLSLSYILDIFKKNTVADRNIVNVLLSLGFFPIILAGPIQRPSTLLPQIESKRVFDYEKAVDGLRQILWGLFVKIAVADNLATEVDKIFLNFSDFTGSTLFLGIVMYTIQIYADFSGYSNIAIGTSKLFGFDLMRNFSYPYFSRNIAEFWKRWHISLTTWFRDYVFLPLSFAISWRIRKERILLIRTDHFIYILASTITWFLTGLWHGANYSFIIWGLINGFFLVAYHFQVKPRKKLLKKFRIDNNNVFIVCAETIFTLCIIMFAWIFFRSANMRDALNYLSGMLSSSLISVPEILPVKTIFLGGIFMFAEWLQRDKFHALQINSISSRLVRWGIYLCCIFMILFFGVGYKKFIYFQF